MLLPPGMRKLALTVHVVTSVGWVGAVLVFLALAVIGMTSEEPALVRGSYLLMEEAARVVLLPIGYVALASGVVQSLGTTWGVFRHYWVVFKLGLTLLAVGVLQVYMETFRGMAAVAADPARALSEVRNPSPVLHSVLALLVLLAATVLAVYKPAGLTRYGWKKQRQMLGR